MVDTLIAALEAVSGTTHKGYTFLDNDLKPTEHPFAELVKEARLRGARLRALGLEKGDRLAMIIPEPEDFVLSFLGAITAGIVPVPMYPPLALGRLDSYIDSAASILRASNARMLLTTKQVSPVLWTLMNKVDGLEDLVLVDKLRDANAPADHTPVEIGPDDLCFLQFTSGSTAAPKGVMVTHKSLAANSKAIMFDGLESDPDIDKGVSWLPLYHDMGLIGFVIAPLFAFVPVVFIPTLAFVKRPNVWMETVHKYRGTITFGPNFAFGLAAKRAQRSKDLDLSCLRVLGCGAEPINAKTMKSFLDVFEPLGVKPRALMPCYGMAEATLAMAFDRLTRPMKTIVIDREAYEEKNLAQVVAERSDKAVDLKSRIELVSCGRTFPGHDLGIMNEQGELLPEGRVGEIVFRGASMTPGYWKNEEATKALLEHGWLHTGDLGFMVDGELYISGRKKDLIILNGRNYYPQAIEWIVEQSEGIRRGNVVAFSVNGDVTERLVVVAETTAADKQVVADAVIANVKAQLGLAVGEVVLVPRGAIPKTSSGKLQRRKTKTHYEDGSIHQLGDRSLGSAAAKVTLFRHMTVSVFARIRHRIRAARGILMRSMFIGAARRNSGDVTEGR